MKNKAVGIMLLGLYLWSSGLNPSLAKEEGEKIPKGLKTKTEIKYKFVKKLGNYDRALHSKLISKYDDKGKLIEGTRYSADGKLEAKNFYKYDDKGNEIEMALYDVNNQLIDKMLSKYDGKGNLIEWVAFDTTGKLEGKYLFKYDDKGHLIEETSYNANSKLEEKYLYKYDNKGNQIEKAWYDANDKLGMKYLSRYDDKGKLIEGAVHDVDGKLKEKQICRYDNKGNQIEETDYVNGKLERKFLWEYDEKGNKIKESGCKIEEKSGKSQEIPVVQTNWEYEFYSEKSGGERMIKIQTDVKDEYVASKTDLLNELVDLKNRTQKAGGNQNGIEYFLVVTDDKDQCLQCGYLSKDNSWHVEIPISEKEIYANDDLTEAEVKTLFTAFYDGTHDWESLKSKIKWYKIE